MLLATGGITIGEKWTTVLPSKVDGDFFYRAQLKQTIALLDMERDRFVLMVLTYVN